jgi:hypothetical protein
MINNNDFSNESNESNEETTSIDESPIAGDMNENSNEEEFDENSLTKEQRAELWDKIGFHKAIGGWWYNLIFMLINLFTGTFVTTLMISYFYKYPSAMAFGGTVNALFALLVFTFDIGTAGVMSRFIPEARISDPTRMIHYIRYFVWYQAITGLIQVTAISVYAIYYANDGDLAYLIWIMLIYSTRQYPGMVSMFSSLLNTMQHFDKAAIVGFTQGEIIQRLTELGFVILGLNYGMANPQIGPLLGIALGQAIGTYVDDFIGMALAMYFFNKVMKRDGFDLKQCFIPYVPLPVVKEVLRFAVKTSVPGFTGNAVNLYVFTLYINNVAQWMLFGAFTGMAGGIVSDINSCRLNVGSLYNESYMNGKKKLAQTVFVKVMRFSCQMLFFFFMIFLSVLYILPEAFEAFNLDNFYPALQFIIPLLIVRTIDILFSQAWPILYATDKPNLLLIFSYSGQILTVIWHTMLVVWLDVPSTPQGFMFCLVFGGAIVGWFLTILQHIYIHYKVIKIKIAWYQTIIAPLLASSICLVLSLSNYYFVFKPLLEINFFFALVVFMIIMMFVGIFIYFPLVGFFGGWDENSVHEFKKVLAISGPSRFIIKPMFKLVRKMIKKSPFHNKFPLDDTEALIEAQELYKMKQENTIKSSLTNL